MLISTATRDSMAQRIRSAYHGDPLPSLEGALEPLDVESAYAIQTANTAIWIGSGRRIVGRKIGLTSTVVQARFGVKHPDYGVLFKDMQIEDGVALDVSLTYQPRAEMELAFVIGRDGMNSQTTLPALIEAIDGVCPAIEIVDTRILDWKITFADTVADNASAAYFVLGTNRAHVRDLDMLSGEIGTAADDPRHSSRYRVNINDALKNTLWLVHTLAKHGDSLKAGDIVLSGAIGPPVSIRAGMCVSANVSSVGSVSFSLSDRK